MILCAPRVGLEPTTTRLTAVCSTIELSRIIRGTPSAVPSKPNTEEVTFHQRHAAGISFTCHRHFFFRGMFSIPYFPRLSSRPISFRQLHILLCFHPGPIYLVVCKGPSTCVGISHLEGGFTLRCLQRLSLPDSATLPWH